MKPFGTLLLILIALTAQSQNLVVQPFLQDAEPFSIAIAWETDSSSQSRVAWGPTAALGDTTDGTSVTGAGLSQIHTVQLTGLQPDTRYHYRVITGAALSAIYDFVTPPLKNSEQGFRLVAMSDMQRDNAHPGKFHEICNEGILGYLYDSIGTDIPRELAFAMLPGDLVDNGYDYPQWANDFFQPSENLFRHIPVYPVLGNHELNTPTYFKYFHLPANGTPGFEEHWWYKDYSNLRIVGLNSNTGYLIQGQLDWLEAVLDDACADPDVDFVFAQLHHPHHSELWPAGNLNFTGEVIARMEQFSTQCGKPSIHFYGHTHGYSRGNSQDHAHVMVNVATAGGSIDYWNEFPQQDYPEHIVSQDEYGFVWVEVEAGDQPRFTLKRISRGNQNAPLDNVLRDIVHIKRFNISPETPAGLFPPAGAMLSPDCPILFSASDYADPDGDQQGAAQWQIATDSAFTNRVYDEWRQHQNWYNSVDLQAGDTLTNELVDILEENTAYFWRVRYRDRVLGWSAWSAPIAFQTTAGAQTANLLVNGGAEDGVTGWTEDAGALEAILSGECAGNQAYAGERLFAVGGVCEDHPYGEAHQDVDLNPYATAVLSGQLKVHFGGWLSDYNGADRPEFRVDFLDQDGGVIGSTPTYGHQSNVWTQFRKTAAVPQQAAALRMVLMGTRNAGNDNDSYFDELFLRLDTVPCAGPLTPVVTPGPETTPDLRAYPNPTAGPFTLLAQQVKAGEAYLIVDPFGRPVLRGQLAGPVTRIDLGDMPAGMYLLQIPGRSGYSLRVVRR